MRKTANVEMDAEGGTGAFDLVSRLHAAILVVDGLAGE